MQYAIIKEKAENADQTVLIYMYAIKMTKANLLMSLFLKNFTVLLCLI